MSIIKVRGGGLTAVQGAIGSVTNLVDQFAAMFAVDVVGVFGQKSYAQLFKAARAVKANVLESSKLMDHPKENGSLVTDFRIIRPAEIELGVICTGASYKDVFKEIKYTFTNAIICTVTTRADAYMNMVIESMPHDETPDMADVIMVPLRMREVQEFASQYQALPAEQVAKPTDQSTVQRGTVQPQQSSVAYSAAQKLGFFSN